jgi:hypothetical protein
VIAGDRQVAGDAGVWGCGERKPHAGVEFSGSIGEGAAGQFVKDGGDGAVHVGFAHDRSSTVCRLTWQGLRATMALARR